MSQTKWHPRNSSLCLLLLLRLQWALRGAGEPLGCLLPRLYLTAVVKSEPLPNTEMGSKGVVPSRFLAGTPNSQYNTEFLRMYKISVIFRRSSHAQGLPFSSTFWLQFLSNFDRQNGWLTPYCFHLFLNLEKVISFSSVISACLALKMFLVVHKNLIWCVFWSNLVWFLCSYFLVI